MDKHQTAGWTGKGRRVLLFLLMWALALCMSSPALAAELDQVVLSNFVITKPDGTPIPDSGIAEQGEVRFTVDWDASSYNNTIKAGDFFDITLPVEMTYPNNPGYREFELKDMNDPTKVLADGKITPASPGGTVRITFRNTVEGQFKVKGNMYIFARIRKMEGYPGDGKTFTLTLGTQTVISGPPIKVTPVVGYDATKEVANKWIGVVEGDPHHIKWTVRINAQEKLMTNVVVKDDLSLSEKALTYLSDSFTLQKILYIHDENGVVIGTDTPKHSAVALTPNVAGSGLVIDPDLQHFTFTLPATELAKDGRYYTYLVMYRTTYVPLTKAANSALVTYSEGTSVTDNNSYTSKDAGGGAIGESTVHFISKRWVGGPEGDHTAIPLTLLQNGSPMAGAPEPTVTGNAPVFDYMWAGLPVHDASDQPYVYSVQEGDGSMLIQLDSGNIYHPTQNESGSVLTNTYVEPVKVDVHMKKNVPSGHKLAADTFRFQLRAQDGTVLDEQGNMADGSVVLSTSFPSIGQYTLFLSEVKGGESSIVYDETEYTLVYDVALVEGKLKATRTQVLKDGKAPDVGQQHDLVFYNEFTRSVAVTKVWEGSPAASVTVQLLADGKPVSGKTLTLNAANSWRGSFASLATYDGTDGHEIVYTVKETPIAGYTSTVTGSPEVGFTVTNKELPPVDPEPPEPSYPTLRVPIQLMKKLSNGKLEAGDFAFELRDGSGKLLATVGNAADGSITFPDRTFSKVVSNYRYTVREVAGADPMITYDDTIYTLKVSTRAVGDKLEATIEVEKNGTPYAGALDFVNTRKLPPTGDRLYLQILLLASASLLLGAGAVVLRRRTREG